MTEDIENVIQGEEPSSQVEAEPVDNEPERTFNSATVKKVVEREKAKAYERATSTCTTTYEQRSSCWFRWDAANDARASGENDC